MKAIGLMSGTSADGVDAALVEIGESDLSLLGYIEVPFPNDVRREILSLCENGRVDAICRQGCRAWGMVCRGCTARVRGSQCQRGEKSM